MTFDGRTQNIKEKVNPAEIIMLLIDDGQDASCRSKFNEL